MNLRKSLFTLFLAPSLALAADVAYSPVGGMTVAVAAGTPSVPVTSAFTMPLLDAPAASGVTVGRVTARTTTSVTVAGANWTAGALASAQFPYALRMTSGAAAGYTFSITANTADTLTLSGGDPVALGVVSGSSGDTFRLLPIDTLNTLFGGSTLLGAATAADADIVILSSAAQSSYYYNTNLNRWVRTTGPTTDRGNTPIPLDSMISVTRKSTALTFRITGRVPAERFALVVNNAGTTYTHTGFPVDVTLGALSLQTALPGWVSSPTAANADTLAVVNGANQTVYFHNGSNWQRTTGPASNRDSIPIPSGNPILIFKKGTTSGSSLLTRNVPYTL